MLVVKGKYRYETDKEVINLKHGDVLFLPKGSNYKYCITTQEAYAKQISFDLDYNADLFLPTELTLLSGEKAKLFFENFDKLFALFNNRENNSHFAVASIIFYLLSLISKEENNKIHTSRISKALVYLSQSEGFDISVNELSAMCGLSVSQFRKLFSDEMGISPLKYKNKLRMERACALLKTGEYNISEVSEITGFDTLYSFSKAFKAVIGTSPKKYMQDKTV